MSLDQVIGKPTTMTAPESEQKERNTLLNQVNSHGFIENYKGVRVASDGKLFQIKDATISVSYTHLRAHETDSYLVCRLLLEKKFSC